MATKVGINGFGRIGRQVFKAIRDYYPDTLEVVAVNDIGDVATMAHLLKYDSNYGKFDGTVEVVEGGLNVDGKFLKVLAERDPANLPWGDMGVDIVVESTGLFRTGETAGKHIEAGAKKVIISAPAKG
jgi:glyceraldehyde 3-phosphate dehydrogenase